MKKIGPTLIVVSALLAGSGIQWYIHQRIAKAPRTADLPALDREFLQSFDAVAGTPDWEEIRATRKILAAALDAERFPLLDSVLSRAQENFERNPACEARLYWLYQVFAATNPAWEERLTNWVGEKRSGHAALTARAVYYDACAWESRGTAWARETSPDQFRGMERYHSLAERDALAAAALRPKSIVALITLIDIARSGSHGNALELAEKAFKADPLSFQAMHAYMISLTPRWCGSYAAMEGFLEKTRAAAKANPELRQLDGLVQWDRGKVLLNAGDSVSALKAYDKALKAGPAWNILHSRGLLLEDMGRTEEALEDFEEAERIRPLVVEPHLEIAGILSRSERWEEAEAQLRIAQELNAFDPDLKATRRRISQEIVVAAYAEAEKGNLSEAIRKYGVAIGTDSSNAEAYRYRASARIKLNDMETALADLQQAIKSDPHSLQAYRDIDWLLAHKQDWKSIIGYWDAFLTLEPGNAAGYFERSGTYFHLGDMEAAKRDAQQACRLGNQEACQVAKDHFGI